MKTLILLILITITLPLLSANRNGESSVVGTWKYYKQSSKNDFQPVINSADAKTWDVEYFVFLDNNKFRHEFVNNQGVIVKTLYGKWKASDDKIKIDYSGIKYSVNTEYFFLDKDLVLGQNFNHVIFTKDVTAKDNDIAMNIKSKP